MLRYIILAPLIGALLNGLVFRSKKGPLSGIVASAASILAFVFSLMAISQLQGLSTPSLVDPWFTWFEAGRISVPFHLELTPLTGVMLVVVSGIGSLIHIYSVSYMSHDASPYRFFTYLNLFLAAMLTLLLSSSLVGVFLGWEGVGLCSYLLIGFWFEKNENAAAGMKAFLVNRIGDLGFLIALFVLFAHAGTANISELITLASEQKIAASALVIAAAGLFWASTGKSAQIPLYVWLPDAMAGPTPVSALIHAATMVTSGLFLTARLWPLFANQALVLEFMLWTGIATALLAALIALTQRDIKKILAYSTVSQLGFMFAALGAGSPAAAIFHVLTHACFKALLFLGAGSVIHGMHEKQDVFEMGGLKHHMKWTHLTFLIGTMAIIGFPLSSGFFSKDMILGKVFAHSLPAFVALLGAALLTAFYMLRCYALVFCGKPRSKEAEHAHESSALMVVPLAVLAVLSAFVGFLEEPAVFFPIHKLTDWVGGSWYAYVPAAAGHHLSHATEWTLMAVVSLLSLSIAWFSYKKYSSFNAQKMQPSGNPFKKLSENKFYVDEIYEYAFKKPLAYLGAWLTKALDGTLINGGLHGLRNSVSFSGQFLALFHTGNIQTYAWYIVVACATAILLWGVGAIAL